MSRTQAGRQIGVGVARNHDDRQSGFFCQTTFGQLFAGRKVSRAAARQAQIGYQERNVFLLENRPGLFGVDRFSDHQASCLQGFGGGFAEFVVVINEEQHIPRLSKPP